MQVVSLHSAPRSGSTWLQTIFESHPKIKSFYQPLFSYAFKNIINDNSTTDDFDKFIENLMTTNDPFVNRKTEYHKSDNNFIPTFDKTNINVILMKNVHHHNLIEKFIQLHPKIKIIGLIRNPCAVINSFINNKHEFKKEWKGTDEWLTGERKNANDKYNFFGFLKWKQLVDIFLHIEEMYPQNIFIVSYEDLIENKYIKELFNFIGLECTDEVMKFIEESHRENVNDSVTSVYKDKSVKNKWKKELDPEIIKYIFNDIKGTKYEKFYI